MLQKTTITLTILSDEPIGDMDIETIVNEMRDGDFSGDFNIGETVNLSRRQMALELLKQGSDPSFIIGDDEGWLYGLHSGDEVTWYDPDGEPQTFIISEITYEGENEPYELDDEETLADQIVIITTKEGSDIQAPLSEFVAPEDVS